VSKSPKRNNAERALERALDRRARADNVDLTLAEVFEVALREGWDSPKLARHPKLHTLLTMRQWTIALKSEDDAKALAAIKDILDRTQGKAVEKIETTHKLAGAADSELDALLLTKLKDSAGGEAEDDEVH
jgi:hypothetical protein